MEPNSDYMNMTISSAFSGFIGGFVQKLSRVTRNDVRKYPLNCTSFGKVWKLAPPNMTSTIAFQVFNKIIYEKISNEFDNSIHPLDQQERCRLAFIVGALSTIITNPIKCMELYNGKRWKHYKDIYPRLDGIKRAGVLYPNFPVRVLKNGILGLCLIALPEALISSSSLLIKSEYRKEVASIISGIVCAILIQPLNGFLKQKIECESNRLFFAELKKCDYSLSKVRPKIPKSKNINWRPIFKTLPKNLLLYPTYILIFQAFNEDKLQNRIDDLCDRVSKLSLKD